MIIVAAGTDPWSPNYGCFVTDVGCQAQQNIAQFFASTIQNLGDFIATLVGMALNGTISSQGWEIARSQYLFWIAVTAPVVMIVALIQIGIAMILQDWSRIGRTAAGAAVAVPFSAFCVWLMQQASTVCDGVTQNLTSAIQGGGLGSGLLRGVGILGSPSGALSASGLTQSTYGKDSLIYSLSSQGAQTASSIGDYVLALFIVLLMMLGTLFLGIAMTLRDFGLLALAAMAPIGLMMIGQPKLAVWGQRWANLTTGLLLAKPLAAGIILLAVELTTDTSANILGVLVAIGAIVAAAFSPLWATRLVAFAGTEVGNALQKRASVRDQMARGQAAAAPVRGAARLARAGR